MAHKDTGNVYYNVLFKNNTNRAKQAHFIETRTVPIIHDASKYKMSIIRFSIPTLSIPIFDFPQNEDGTPNNQFYKFTFFFNNHYYSQYVEFLNWNPGYGTSVYNYLQFIDMLNIALYNCYMQVKTAEPTFGAQTPPYFTIDARHDNLQLNTEVYYAEANILIYLNFELYQFLYSLPRVFYSYDDVNGRDVSLIIQPTGNNDIIAVNPPYPTINTYPTNLTGYFMVSELPILQNWQSIKSLVITSSFLRTRSENIQTPNSKDSDANFNIITDFEIPRSLGVQSGRDWQEYHAAIYRYCDLFGSEPLRTVDINIYYTNLNGELKPLYIDPYYYFTLKIMFEKK